MFEPNRVPKNCDLDFELVTFFSLSLFSFQRPTTYDSRIFCESPFCGDSVRFIEPGNALYSGFEIGQHFFLNFFRNPQKTTFRPLFAGKFNQTPNQFYVVIAGSYPPVHNIDLPSRPTPPAGPSAGRLPAELAWSADWPWAAALDEKTHSDLPTMAFCTTLAGLQSDAVHFSRRQQLTSS